jgi:hypothetical protein
MNFAWIAPEVMQRLAGSLLHFIWQGAVIAIVAAIGLRLLRHRSAEARYALAIVSLACMLAAPMFTLAFYAQTGAVAQRLLESVSQVTGGGPTLEATLWAQRILVMSFTLQSVPLGTYRVSLGPVPQNGYIKSVRYGNTEGLQTGITVQLPSELTIVVSAKPGTVQGRVVNDRNEPVPNVMTVLVPDNDLRTRTDLFKNAATSPSGEFKFFGLTPGSYKLFAWEEVENGAWLNSEFMRKYEELGSVVVVGESEVQQVQLGMIQN